MHILNLISYVYESIMTYDFIQKAFIVGVVISIVTSILGVILVLKRYSMIGDGLSHVSFGALSIAMVMGLSPLKVAIPIVCLFSVLLLKLGNKKIKGDSLLAIISSSFMALGIILASYFGSSANINGYLMGSLYAVSTEDLHIATIVCIFVIISFVLFYNKIFCATFDEEFSKAVGIKPGIYDTLFAILTSLSVVISVKLVGALLVSSLIVFPALSAMRVFKSFLKVMIASVIISVVCFLIGFTLTIIIDKVPTGACITLVNLCVFIIFSFVGLLRDNS